MVRYNPKDEQDVLWAEWRTLLAENKFLNNKIHCLKLSMTHKEYLDMAFSRFLENLDHKEQRIVSELKALQKEGRKKFFSFSSIEETNLKIKKYISLKEKHNLILKEGISFIENSVKKVS